MLMEKSKEVLRRVYEVYRSGSPAAKLDESACESKQEWQEVLIALQQLEAENMIHYIDTGKDIYSAELLPKGIAYCEKMFKS